MSKLISSYPILCISNTVVQIKTYKTHKFILLKSINYKSCKLLFRVLMPLSQIRTHEKTIKFVYFITSILWFTIFRKLFKFFAIKCGVAIFLRCQILKYSNFHYSKELRKFRFKTP